MYKDPKSMIVEIAIADHAEGKTETGRQLAAKLNAGGFRTTYGELYQGGRGTYRLLKVTYDSCERAGDFAGAIAVAHAFVNQQGHPAWKER